MNRRALAMRLVVVGLVGLFIVWIARNTYFDDVTVPMPLKGEAARNPFYGAQKFVEALGATSEWDRFQKQVPGDAVIVVSSWHWDLAEGRRSRMEEWVEAGGRLVLDHTLVGGEDEFARWSGISRRMRPAPEAKPEKKEEDEDAEERPLPRGAEALRSCRMLRETQRAVGSRASSPANYELCTPKERSSLVTTRPVAWALQDDVGNQVLRVNVGKGSVTVINAVPFLYRTFLQGDHAALLAGATQLRRGDEVHFLSEEEHASLLTLAWHFGWPVVVLFLSLIGFALWRNGVRFGPLAAVPDRARRSLAEQIRGTGQFAVRFGGGKALHAAAVRALHEAARKRVIDFDRLSEDERVNALARLADLAPVALAAALHHSGPRRSHELRNALALIESARRRISEREKVSPWKLSRT